MSRAQLLAIIIALLILTPVRAARADTVAVTPTRVFMTKTKRSETLVVHNRSTGALRYQVTVHAWKQTPQGEMKLAPTTDLVVYPTLMSLKPGQHKRVKIASVLPPGQLERAYRIFLEPLRGDGVSTLMGLRIQTRFGIPLFVKPRDAKPRPKVYLRLRHGQLFASVVNKGNTFFQIRSLQLRGESEDGTVLFSRIRKGWYVLAGDERRYHLPAARCSELRRVKATLRTTHGIERMTLNVDPSNCHQ